MGQLLGLGAAATTAGAVTTPLAAGLKMGTTIGGLTAPAGFTLAPTIGATLPTGSLLTAGGGGLGGLGGAGGLLGGSGALLPKFASLSGAGGSLLGGGGLGGALTPTGLASLKMPAGSLLQGGTNLAAPTFKSLSMANAPLYGGEAANLSNLGFQSAKLNPNFIKTADLSRAGTISEKLAATTPQVAETPGLVENIRAFKTATEGPASMSYAKGAQGISPNVAQLPPSSPIIKGENFLSNLGNLIQNPSMDAAGDYVKEHPLATAGAAYGLYNAMKPKQKPPEQDLGSIRPYEFSRTELEDTREPGSTAQRQYFRSEFIPLEPYSATSPKAKEIEKIAEGGIAKAYAVGGPVEMMAAQNAVGANTGYPMAGINTAMYSNPMVQRPEAVNVISPSGDAGVAAYSGEPKFARGGLSDLGDYSDGGRLLKGPGDGVSDSIPAVIGKRQPARLADGEFVIPARIVSELGNGSTEAGARKLYAMMERVQATRKKSIGKKKVAVNSKADKHLPA